MKSDVVIIGGGPVGLFLGACLAQQGLDFVLLEAREQALQHSRSIGIHPPALEHFERLGIVKDFLDFGVKVNTAQVFAGRRLLGEFSFESCPKPYAFVLTLPQLETEILLEKHLDRLAPGKLWRGARLKQFKESAAGVDVMFEREGSFETLRAGYLVACDGHLSQVRQSLGLAVARKVYPDSYIMGDFIDTTSLGTKAGIFLTSQGVIESFPLPDNKRRWVVKTPDYLEHPSAEALAAIILERLNYELPLDTMTMLSSFRPDYLLAKRFVQGRVILAGDAAHVLSPIGGQGMNLGWLDAWDVAKTLEQILKRQLPPERTLARYHQRRYQAAKTAAQRAEMNMWLGRESRFPFFRFGLVWLLTHRPLEPLFARQFTMRGL